MRAKIPDSVCAYCLGKIDHSEAQLARGDFHVHSLCQADKERAGVYLHADGTMQVNGQHLTDTAIARSIMLAAMAHVLETKRQYQ